MPRECWRAPVVGSEARVDKKYTDNRLRNSRIVPDLHTASAIKFPAAAAAAAAAAAPAVVGLVPNATANRLICSTKRLMKQIRSETNVNEGVGSRGVGGGEEMHDGRAERKTCILYQVLPSSTEAVTHRLQFASRAKEMRRRRASKCRL
jgi:hypothetical protein